MARVLAISSQVVRGHVGLGAIVPALRRQGHEVWPLPTVLLSNHPGHARFHVVRIPPEDVTRMTETLAANGWLEEIDGVITGYLPTQGHVRAVADVIGRLRAKRRLTYLCDPVIGDAPKGIYIDIHAARAIRDALVPLADVATPNRFELGWMTGKPCDDLAAVEIAARMLPSKSTVVTSASVHAGRIVNLLWAGGMMHHCAAAERPGAPHGTGDLMAGLLLGHLLNGAAAEVAFGRAIAGVDAVLAASEGRDELHIFGGSAWSDAPPATVITPVSGLKGGDGRPR